MPSRNPNCSYCKLHREAHTVCVDGSGPLNAKIMIVGEAPGENEDREGVPFIGESGRVLDQMLAQAGLSRAEVRITNTVRCRPPMNRTPLADEQKACLGYLLQEIEEVKPKVIVAMGGAALKALVGRESVGKERGHLLTPKAGIRIADAALVASYHPAYYLYTHNTSVLEAMRDDLSLAARIVNPKVEDDKPTALLLPGYTAEALAQALSTLEGAKVAACDLEWRGVEKEGMYWPWRTGAEPYSIALSARMPDGIIRSVGISLPLPDQAAFDILQAFFRAVPLVFHNAQADLIWLKALGFVVRLAGDTMLLAQLLDEGRSLTLEALATTLAGVDPGWKQPLWETRPLTTEDWERLFTHNCGDTMSTLILAEVLHKQLAERPEIERQRVSTFYRNLSLPAIPMFVDVALNGTRLDVESLDDEIEKSRAKTIELCGQFAETIRNAHEQAPEFTPREAGEVATSTHKTVRILQDVFRLPVLSSSAGVLDEYLAYPVVKQIQAIRHEQKARGTYFNPWRKLIDECGGRIHTLYRLAGARTGRTSAELEYGGSIQVAPREERVRRLITVDEGNSLVAADQSQMELRVSAWFANEPTMLQLYREDADIHLSTAMAIDKATTLRTAAEIAQHEVSYEQAVQMLLHTPDLVKRYPVWKELRQQAKGVNFGLIYGMGAEKLVIYCRSSYGVELTLDEARVIRARYFELYSKLLDWHARCEAEWQRDGYTVTPLGRYRRHIEDARKAINTPVQSTASDLTVLAMIEVHKELIRRKLPARLIGFVHDNIMVEARSGAVSEEVRVILEDKMSNPPIERFGIHDVPVPFKAEAKISQRWS